MNRSLVRLARTVYKATPFPSVRQMYFGAFCALMRNRRARATIQGSTFDLDLGEMIDVALYLEQYELDVTAALHRHCRAGMTALDIGANIGAHTLTLGRLVTKAGAVYAFEPTGFAYDKLARNVSLNDAPQIHAVKAAVSDRAAASQVIRYRSSWTTAGGRRDAEGRVDFIRLDDWCPGHGVGAIDFIKIDVDGNEFEALSGGARLLAAHRPVIVMEAVGPHFDNPARNPFVLLKDLGYRFRDAKTDREYETVDALAEIFPANDTGMTMSINLVAQAG